MKHEMQSAQSLYERPFPLQQGALDWLCSAYAAVNLLYLKDQVGSTAECATKFAKAFEYLLAPEVKSKADSKGTGCGFDALSYLTGGVWPHHDLKSVFEAFGLDISDPAYSPNSEVLGKMVAENNAAIVYLISKDGRKGLGGEVEANFTHYSIVTKVTDQHLTLFDSAGLATIELLDGRLWLTGFEVEIYRAWSAQLI